MSAIHGDTRLLIPRTRGARGAGVMFSRALKDARVSTIVFALGTVAYVLAMTAFFPSIRDNAGQMDEFLDAYPESLRKAFGIEDFGTLGGFLSAEVLSFVWPLVAAVFAILAGSAIVAQEVDRGTADFWLSAPASRTALLLGKLAAAAVGALVLAGATVAALAVAGPLVDEPFAGRALLATGVVLLVFTLVLLAVATLLSALLSDRGLAAGLAAGFTLVSYVAWVISELSGGWTWLRYGSIFTAYAPQPALTHAELHWPALGVLVVLAVACVAAACRVFERRDAIG